MEAPYCKKTEGKYIISPWEVTIFMVYYHLFSKSEYAKQIAIRRILRWHAAAMTRIRGRENSRRIIIVGKGKGVKESAVRYDGRDFDLVVVRFAWWLWIRFVDWLFVCVWLFVWINNKWVDGNEENAGMKRLVCTIGSNMIEYRLAKWMDQRSIEKDHRLLDELTMQG